MSVSAEDLEEMHETQRKQQQKQETQRRASSQAEQVAGEIGVPTKDDMMDAFVKHDVTFDDQSLNMLEYYLTRDFPMANFNEQRLRLTESELRIAENQFLDAHPNAECVLQGDVAAFVFDDCREALSTLSSKQIQVTEQIFRQARNRATRGIEMKQQEMTRSVFSVSSHRDDDNGDDSGGGLLGRLGI